MRVISVVAAMALLCTCLAERSAAEGIGIHADVTYVTRYMAHGFNIGDDEPSLQPSVTVDSLLPGLQLVCWSSLPIDRDFNAADELDLLVKYNHTFFVDQPWAVKLHGFVDYWVYPHLKVEQNRDGNTIPATRKEGFKNSLGVSLPALLPIGESCLVPNYSVYYWMPAADDLFAEGAAHELSLSYSLPIPDRILRQENQVINLAASATYHTGAFDVEEGYSHATAHASTAFRLAGIALTPGVHYQWSHAKTVDPEDEFWVSVSASRSF